jgi:hypothetical protein
MRRHHYTTGAVAIWQDTALAIELQDGGIVLVGPQRAAWLAARLTDYAAKCSSQADAELADAIAKRKDES